MTDQDKPLKVTEIMMKIQSYICVKLVSEDGNLTVWVNKKFLDEIGDFNLYGSGERNPVKRIHVATGKVDAIVMPVRNSVKEE